MVLRNATLHTILDDSNSHNLHTAAMQSHITTPTLLHLSCSLLQEPGMCYLSPSLPQKRTVFTNYHPQYWRLITTFIYFGPPSLDLVFHLFFMSRYSRLLESTSGSSPATFSWLLLYATTTLLTLSSFLTWTPFLGHSLSQTLVYIWSRRNPDTRLAFLGVLVFNAPYLPWVLMGFSLFMHGSIPKDEILGVIVGHVYYFFVDVWPGIHPGSRPMDPPEWWVGLWERRRRDPATGARDVQGDVQAAANRVGDVH